MLLFPNCKINIGLDIVAKRPDGFHDIETLMVPVMSLCDSLEIVVSDEFAFSSSGIEVDCTESENSIVSAWRLMKERYSVGNVKIHLHKVIPFGAGLGGGSSDAAFAIKGINDIFELNLSTTQMESLAAELGNDTPFFIQNRPMICSGRGEILDTFDISLDNLWWVIVKPDFSISTQQAYLGVTPQCPQVRLKERLRLPIREWQNTIINQFEKTLHNSHPELNTIKQSLINSGAIYSSLSGSGSAVFGLFDKQPDFNQPNQNVTIFTGKF